MKVNLFYILNNLSYYHKNYIFQGKQNIIKILGKTHFHIIGNYDKSHI
jgi:hypothetical protein